MSYKIGSAVLGITLIAAANAVHASPRACQIITRAHLPEHGLRASEHGVLFSPAEFVFDDKPHPFEVFSDAALDPRVTGQMCVRYEIENTGPGTIRHLQWDRLLDRAFAIALPSNERMTRGARLPTNVQTPVPVASYLQAFYASYAEVQVWDAVPIFGNLHTAPESGSADDLPAPDPIPSRTAGNILTFYPEDVSPTLSATLEEMDIERRPVLAFFANDVFAAHPIEDVIILPEHSIRIDSSAEVRHGAAVVETTITVIESEAKEITLSSSVLSAMESAADIDEFLKLLLENRDAPVWYSGPIYHLRQTYTIEEHADKAWTYMINFPVTIFFDEQAVCFRTFTYSPFPISVTEEFCDIK